MQIGTSFASVSTIPLALLAALAAGGWLHSRASGQGGPGAALGEDALQHADGLARGRLRALTVADDACAATANVLARAGILGAHEDLSIALASCRNLVDEEQAQECVEEAFEEFLEELELVGEVREARMELCEQLGGGPYDPQIDPADFVGTIDNPWLPLAVGSTWTYHKPTEEGLEVLESTVTGETKEILGVQCTVVHEVETVDGVLAEDTEDWFAQDVDGNVWYFGELSFSYDDEGVLEGVEGSWEAGEDGAKPGIVMLADPRVGTTYRQEFLLTEAEDAATVAALGVPVSVPFGSFPSCLQTFDFTPLEPDEAEHKHYAMGVGLVLEIDLESGERNELVAFVPGR